MAFRFPLVFKILAGVAAVLYPALMYYVLVVRQAPLRLFSLVIIALALAAFFVRTSAPKGAKKGGSWMWASAPLLGVGAACLITGSAAFLKWYPVLMNVLFLAAFGGTLFFPPTMIFRFATMQDKSIKGSSNEQRVAAYCRTVTCAWCGFFIGNGGIAAWTVFSGSDALWSVYNGGVSYVLIGVFFMVELIIRKRVQQKMPPEKNRETAGFDSVENITVVAQTETSVSVAFSLPDTSPYFDGHFPGFPILPAVAQTELVVRFASRYLGTGAALAEIRRMKFTSLVRPGAPLLLELERQEEVVSFTLRSPRDETVYSVGTVVPDTGAARVRQGALIPVYRHGKTACPLAERLAAGGLPVIMVDDGNDEETRALLAACAARAPGMALVRLEQNAGKGGAVLKGLEKAAEWGLTHVLQMDADGQHDAAMVGFFLEKSAQYPDRVICGYPEFDATAPRGRVIGRKISVFWAAIVTLSTAIKDALCGFRVYPVDAVLRAAQSPFLDRRMGFDPEILARLCWQGVYPLFYPLKVCYPPGGVSNFHAVRDNIRVSWVFTRLCVGMLIRLPLLLARKAGLGSGR